MTANPNIAAFVFLTDFDPHPPRGGGALRDYAWMQILSHAGSLSTLFTSQMRARSQFHPARLWSPFRPYPLNGYQPHVVEALREHYIPGSVLILSRLVQGKYILPAKRIGYRVILDEHNIEYELLQQLGNPLRSLNRVEKEFWNLADAVVCTTPQDAKTIQAHCKNPVFVLPNMIIPSVLSEEHPQTIDPPPPSGTHQLLIPGTFDYLPNRLGVEWYLNEIHPRLDLRSHPSLQVIIAGKNPDPHWAQAPHVQVIDSPKSMHSSFRTATAVLVPLLQGGGSRLKIAEGLTHGRWVISTSKGAEGYDSSRYPSLLICDQPEDFARRIQELTRAPLSWEPVQTSFAHYLEDFDLETWAEKFKKWVNLCLG